MKLRIVIILLGCVALVGCQKTGIIKAQSIDKKISFVFSENNAEWPRYIIQDFEIVKLGCKTDCIMWRFQKISDDYSTKQAMPFTTPLSYGQQLPDSKTELQAKKLTPDKYRIGATVVLVEENESITSLLFFGEFSFSRDGGVINISN